MNTQTRQQWSQFYRTFQEPRSYTKTIDIERTLDAFSCGFEVSVLMWEDNQNMPSVECVSAVIAFNDGGQQVTNPATLNRLNTLAEQWCKDHLDELVDLIEKASKE